MYSNSSHANLYVRGLYQRRDWFSKAEDFIFQKTGMMLAIYDTDTHCVINQKLTLEMLKEISDSEDVLEVTDVVAFEDLVHLMNI